MTGGMWRFITEIQRDVKCGSLTVHAILGSESSRHDISPPDGFKGSAAAAIFKCRLHIVHGQWIKPSKIK